MGIFGDQDWNSVPDDPFALPDNSYVAFVTNVKVGPTKAGDKVGMTITYTIDGGGYDGREVTEWKRIPQVDNPKSPSDSEKRDLSFLKARMRDLGVPAERMNSIEPDDLIGIRCVITTRQSGQYTNVTRVQHVDESFTIDVEV